MAAAAAAAAATEVEANGLGPRLLVLRQLRSCYRPYAVKKTRSPDFDNARWRWPLLGDRDVCRTHAPGLQQLTGLQRRAA
jgi:hypothetical protein